MAKEAARKALAIDESVADAHFALAGVLDTYEWNWAGAEREYRRALDLNPGDALVRCNHAVLLARQGRRDASVAEARHAVDHDPLSVYNRFALAVVLNLARRFDEAMTEARAGVELEGAYHLLHWDLGLALVGLGRYDEAVEALKQAAILAPDDPTALAYLGWALGLAGRRQEGLTLLGDLERRRTHEYVSGFFMALVNVGLGEQDQAMSWLNRAAEDRDAMLPHLNVFPALDPLRADPRFQALLRRMHFPETAASGVAEAP